MLPCISDSDEDPIPPTQREIKKARRKKTSNFVSDSGQSISELSESPHVYMKKDAYGLERVNER